MPDRLIPLIGFLLFLTVAAWAMQPDGIFGTLYVDTDAVLPDNSIQESELDIGTVPSEDDILRWDDAVGKLAWEPIGFNAKDWSDVVASSPGVCPLTPGGPPSTGGHAFAGLNGDLPLSTYFLGVFVQSSTPILTYDVTFYPFGFVGGPPRLFVKVLDLTSAGLRLPVTVAAVIGQSAQPVRMTGSSSALATGLYVVWVEGSHLSVLRRWCPHISSIALATA